MSDLVYIPGDTVHVSAIAEVVWQDENAVCVAVPGVDEPFIVPLRTDDGGELRAVLLEPALTAPRPGDVYQARLTGFLWMAVNAAADALTDPEIRFVSAQDGKVCDPAAVLREYGPLRRVVAVDGADRPAMFHLPPPPDLPASDAGLLDEDLADPLPVPEAIDPAAAVALPPLSADVYVPPMPPPSIVLASASTAPGEVDDPTVPVSTTYASVTDQDPGVLAVRTLAGEATTYLVPVVPDGDADRTEVWAGVLSAGGWERTGGWRRTGADDGWRAPVRPATPAEPASGPAQVDAGVA